MTVNTASTSSGKGIAAASAGTADLGASDAYLSSGDLVKTPTLLNIPLAIAAQTVIYNLPGMSNSDHVKLDGAVLAGIYEGEHHDVGRPADRRAQPAPDPARHSRSCRCTAPTAPVTPSCSPATCPPARFRPRLQWNNTIGYGTTVAWPTVPGEVHEAGSVNVLHACETTPGCVAYNGISYLSQALTGNLGEAELANYAGQYTLPTAQAIQDSVASFVSLTPPNETISMIDGPSPTGYPIVNYEYAVVSTRQPTAAKASALRAFLKWVITTGNQPSYLSAYGFQPLPGALVKLGEQQIAEIGS